MTFFGCTSETAAEKPLKKVRQTVFLGGSCNPTTWRHDVAIPLLIANRVGFYNPQVDDWDEGLVTLEAAAKEESEHLLFVIDNQTRGIASIAEAGVCIGAGRTVHLVLQEFEGDAVNGILPAEFRDLNRGRAYLRGMATDPKTRRNAVVYGSVEEAVRGVIAAVRAAAS